MSAEKVAVGENAASYTIEIDVADLGVTTVVPSETPTLASAESDDEQADSKETESSEE